MKVDALILGSSSEPTPSLERIGRLTTAQYFDMIRMGIIPEGAPYELLDGLIVLIDRSKKGEPLMSIGDDHTLVVGLLSLVAAKLAGRGCFLQLQCPVTLSEFHAPEPDGAIIRGSLRDYAKRSRFAADVSSVIEIGNSSAASDRSDKGPKYAEAGIAQFVLINLVNNTIEIYENPNTTDRKYDSCRIVTSGQEVDFLLSDGTRLNVLAEELLP